MKTIKLLSVALLTVFALGLSSCGNSPAKDFADSLEKITKEIKDAKSEINPQLIATQLQEADKIINDNTEYELTSSDKSAIKKAMTSYIIESTKKNAEIFGFEVTDAQIKEITDIISSVVDKAKTLGDLNDPENAEAEYPEVDGDEIVEFDNIDQAVDSLATAE